MAYKKSSGKFTRKFGSALKAINDFDHLKDFIIEEVSCVSVSGDDVV